MPVSVQAGGPAAFQKPASQLSQGKLEAREELACFQVAVLEGGEPAREFPVCFEEILS